MSDVNVISEPGFTRHVQTVSDGLQTLNNVSWPVVLLNTSMARYMAQLFHSCSSVSTICFRRPIVIPMNSNIVWPFARTQRPSTASNGCATLDFPLQINRRRSSTGTLRAAAKALLLTGQVHVAQGPCRSDSRLLGWCTRNCCLAL